MLKELPSPKIIVEHLKVHFQGFVGINSTDKSEACVYFIAAQFQSPKGRQLEEFRKFYVRLDRYLARYGFDRKRCQRPLCYAFKSSKASKLGNSFIFENGIPHVQAVILVSPFDLEEFELVFTQATKEFLGSIRRVNIDVFDRRWGTIEGLISQCQRHIRSGAPSFGAEWYVSPNGDVK